MSDPHVAADSASAALISRHGEAERARIERGVRQVLAYWRATDGSPEELRAFLEAEFLPRGPALDAAFARFEVALERLHGHLLALARDLRFPIDVETGPLTPLDERLATFDPFAHLDEDLFATKVALRRAAQLPADDARRAARGRRRLVAPAVGRGAPGGGGSRAACRPRSRSG